MIRSVATIAAAKGSWTDDSECHCPACGETSHVRDAFEMGEGSEYDCRKCGVTLVVHDIEAMRRWQFAVLREGESR